MLQGQVEHGHATLDIVEPRVVRRRAAVKQQIGAARAQQPDVGELHRAFLHVLLGATVGPLDDHHNLRLGLHIQHCLPARRRRRIPPIQRGSAAAQAEAAREVDGLEHLGAVAERARCLEGRVVQAHGERAASPRLVGVGHVRHRRAEGDGGGDRCAMPAMVEGGEGYAEEGRGGAARPHVGGDARPGLARRDLALGVVR
mmetsp:Transcript_4078/g.10756  ORF Transcript_4078/g.10756 Transcript_4078/m.10756 type:complete len:200 (-) Transcript_4078:574-1173(-)|eukprot:2220089-Prymnesium_polylepis.1